jgi:hypothetical protein
LIKQLIVDAITNSQYDFKFVESIEGYSFYQKKDGENKRFLVIAEASHLLSPIDYNVNIEEKVPSSMKADPAFEKNTDVIILFKIDGNNDFDDFEREIFLIEENPYYYKKYVFYYFSEELDFIATFDFHALSDVFLDREKFKKYKKTPKIPSDYTIAARFFIKLPFIEVPITEGKLDNVSDIYNGAITTANLSEFDTSLESMFEKHQNDCSALIEEYIDEKMESN